MKRSPRKLKHWAKEAYLSLEQAIGLFGEKYSTPTEEEKLELINFATAFAAMNRGIKDSSVVENAYCYVYQHLEEDLNVKPEDEDVQYSILFLLAYLDSHVSFGIISAMKAEDIMEFLSLNYEVSINI